MPRHKPNSRASNALVQRSNRVRRLQRRRSPPCLGASPRRKPSRELKSIPTFSQASRIKRSRKRSRLATRLSGNRRRPVRRQIVRQLCQRRTLLRTSPRLRRNASSKPRLSPRWHRHRLPSRISEHEPLRGRIWRRWPRKLRLHPLRARKRIQPSRRLRALSRGRNPRRRLKHKPPWPSRQRLRPQHRPR